MAGQGNSDSIAAGTRDLLERNLPVKAEIRWFDESGHVMLPDKSAEQVIEATGSFCLEHLILI